eukprot:scaffold2568_cov246-Pinguiococcus_pyrenoidosus.AAC.4
MSTIATRSSRWDSIPCRAATAMLLKMQKPQLSPPSSRPFLPAWWPGGRTTQNALRALPSSTISTAWTAAPAARRAACSEPGLKLVSASWALFRSATTASDCASISAWVAPGSGRFLCTAGVKGIALVAPVTSSDLERLFTRRKNLAL